MISKFNGHNIVIKVSIKKIKDARKNFQDQN